MSNKILVVCGIIFFNGKYLITKRLNGKWEFPGGKVENDEVNEIALKRELEEELGCYSLVGDLIHTEELEGYLFNFYNVKIVDDYLTLDKKSHLEHKWVKVDELKDFDFMDADKSIVVKLSNLF